MAALLASLIILILLVVLIRLAALLLLLSSLLAGLVLILLTRTFLALVTVLIIGHVALPIFERSNRVGPKRWVAGLIFLMTGVTAIGIFGAIAFIWGPYLGGELW